jgi:hypothetical protein
MNMSNFFKYLFLILILNIYNSKAQTFLPIDTVYSFKPGTGQNVGQEDEYYPMNIYGLPSDSATKEKQEVRPKEILSLGLGGEITVGLKNRLIYDIPGIDFIIYENVFKNPYKDIYFAEPAVVSVSYDGVEFQEFHFDSTSLEGCAGTKPTITEGVDYDPYLCGGNAFDLDELGLNEIQYIRIKDITEMLINNPAHNYYDPTLTGFDLDAVIVTGIENITSIHNNAEKKLINDDRLFLLELEQTADFYLYDLTGKLLINKNKSKFIIINKGKLPAGVYFLRVIQNNELFRYKFINQ